jgi:hypothetical protein
MSPVLKIETGRSPSPTCFYAQSGHALSPLPPRLLHNLNFSPCHRGKVPADVINTTSHAIQIISIAMSLPRSRIFITQLLDSLPSSSSHTGDNGNPLSAVPETAKKQLLSLQVLFPNEFLPALDLLDRRLVTRLRIGDDDGKTDSAQKDAVVAHAESDDNMNEILVDTIRKSIDEPAIDSAGAPEAPTIVNDTAMPNALPSAITTASTTSHNSIYYVRSAQLRSSRYSASYDTTISYEVRLRAWNCSCPAFAFAAFPAIHPEPAIPIYDEDMRSTEDEMQNNAWIFGGVSLGDTVSPVCKHLLACVLVEKCGGLFGGFMEERVVSVEEAAGWAAGWGDS